MTDSVKKIQNSFLDRFRNDSEQNFCMDNAVQSVNNFILETEILNQQNNIKQINFIDLIENLKNNNVNLDNYEEIFCLNNFQATELSPNTEEQTRNIRYKDKSGVTVAIVQINHNNNKISVQSFGNIFPIQEYTSPNDVYKRVFTQAKLLNWTTEDGGINQFDGNIEIRFKDGLGNVMAAVIMKDNSNYIDTVVEYWYNKNQKTRMLHTNLYGQSITYYNQLNESIQIICIDIDTDGFIYNITSTFNNSF